MDIMRLHAFTTPCVGALRVGRLTVMQGSQLCQPKVQQSPAPLTPVRLLLCSVITAARDAGQVPSASASQHCNFLPHPL